MMNFAYDGFTHEGNKRLFHFRRINAIGPASVFTIEAELALLSGNKLSIQAAPLFCLKILESEITRGETGLDRFRPYMLGIADFAAFNAERDRLETQARFKKRAVRRPPRP